MPDLRAGTGPGEHPAQWPQQDMVLASGVRVARNAEAPMRDGTILRADVYRPAERGSYPVLLMRVPYGKDTAQGFVFQHPAWYARHGYIVVVQDCRGRFASQGRFDPLRHEAQDGYDSVEWAASLAESTGLVGMYGFSYAGATQLLAASEQPPSLRCCAPAFTASDYYDGWMYEGGILNLSFVMSWTVLMLAMQEAVHAGDLAAARTIHRRSQGFPAMFSERPLNELSLLRDTGVAPYFFDWLRHDVRDDYWEEVGLPERYDRISVPCLHIGGWYDVFASGTVRNFEELSHRAGTDPTREQRLMMGPWIHMPWAPEATGPGLGTSFRNRVDPAQLAWFDRWLKPADADATISSSGAADETDAVSHFVMGANRWDASTRWPPSSSQTVLFLHSEGQANSRSGDGRLTAAVPDAGTPPDVFIFDPTNPVMSSGGNSCCNSAVSPMGQRCQASVEVRNDVLVYTSDPVAHDLLVTGVPSVSLFAATTARDTDWVVRLVDVDETGTAVNVCQGAVRARHRHSLSHPEFVPPNTAAQFEITMSPTSWLFRRGHRIRLQVTSSDFPAKDPNRNTGEAQASAAPWDYRVATQTVLHDPEHPSVLRLPGGSE